MRASSASSASEVLRDFVALFQHVAVTSEGAAGCAVAGVTIDIPFGDGELLVVAREAFHSWVALLALQLGNVGTEKKRAAEIAMITVASVEGALILCRAEGGAGPMNTVAKQLLLLVEPKE
jgi:hypothetical protein